MVIIHGAGSRKENHGDFARACNAGGWAAVTYDQRGHGASTDVMAPGAVADVALMARLLAENEGVDTRRICTRGSSMGGFMAIHAAAMHDEIAGVIAICPADEQHLRRGLRAGRLEMRADPGALDAWLGELDLRHSVASLAPKPLLLLHARGDEQVPSDLSQELYEQAGEPRKLIIVPGGHHRSVQHDAELQGISVRWLERALPS
jgi:putative redox protein